MIKNYFKIALRNFGRHKLFTLINIIGLSVGISAALVIYLIVHFDFTFDKFHPDGDRIYRAVTEFSFSGEVGYNSGVSGPLAGAVKSEVTGVKDVVPFFTLNQVNVFVPKVGADVPAKFKNQENAVLADARYFNLFKYNWLAGSPKTALNEPYQLVITSDQAKIYFPNIPYNQVLGKTVIFDTIKTTVTGIVQTPVQNTDLYFQDFISYSTGLSNADLKGSLQLTEWGSTTSASALFIKLADNVNPANVEKQLNVLFKKHNPGRKEDAGNKRVYHLQPLNDLHFNKDYSNFDNGRIANKATLYGLLAIATFLLALGCINFVNLTTAQASQRAKEIGIRKTMGSTRRQLILQFLSETFLVTLLAVIIAILIAPFILKLFADFIPAGVKVDYLHQPNLILFLVGLTFAVSLLSGFYPALVLSGYKPALVLKNQANSGTSKTRNAILRKSLTVAQFVIAQFFIMATILVSKQVYYALHKDLGFKKEAILNIGIPFKGLDSHKKQQVFMNAINTIPQIEMISVGGPAPSSGNTMSTEVKYKDGKKEIKTDVQQKFVDENYIKIYHIKLLAGRNLQASDSVKAILINQTYARVLGFKNPAAAIGHMVDYNDKKTEIIGVVGDFYQKSLHSPIKPLAMLTTSKFINRTFHLALKPQIKGRNEWKTAINSIEKAWKQVYPDDDFDYRFFDESIAKFYKSEQQTSTLLTWATGLSVFISCLGLLGLAMYTTNLRTKEIGVRKVLGASVSQIVTLLSTELVFLILLAFILVTPLAWYAMHKWMESFADRTTISWWIFILSGTGMLLAALCTLSFQTIKAAIANPVKSLRSE